MKIDRVDVRRLEIPLERPYQLAFGPVSHYDTIVVSVTGSDGRTGHGEATLLTGYTDETIGGSHALARAVASKLPGTEVASSVARFEALGAKAPFVATAFRTALDMAFGNPLLSPVAGTRVPILALLQGSDRAEMEDDFARILADGCRTIKLKVGFDVVRDLRRVETVQAIVGGRVPVRVDANQGYSAAEAVAFIRALDPRGIELFEQPCKAADWNAHREAAAAAAVTGVPLMLDESIYGIDDIERAAREQACRFVKVKLMKFVGVDALAAAIRRIVALGMRPVLGNGVACDLSCWMEACVAAQCIDNAGEMNGFLKARRMLFADPLVFDQGDIVLAAGPPELDPAVLEAHACAHDSFHARRTECHAPS